MTHPEETCQRCGRPNIWSWSVDSDRFNVAVEALGLTVAAIICPVCFAEGHEKATGLRCTWRLIPADGGFHFPPDEITHETPLGLDADTLSVQWCQTHGSVDVDGYCEAAHANASSGRWPRDMFDDVIAKRFGKCHIVSRLLMDAVAFTPQGDIDDYPGQHEGPWT